MGRVSLLGRNAPGLVSTHSASARLPQSKGSRYCYARLGRFHYSYFQPRSAPRRNLLRLRRIPLRSAFMRHGSSVLFILALAGSFAALSGCSPKIGDACATSTDCSINGDRLCDTTQPGGYCTIFNCEPDTCPDEAVCVAFDDRIDRNCPPSHQWSRFERTYCMLRCESDEDCRAGYVCMDTTSVDDPLGAYVVDTSPAGYKICVVPWSEQSESGANDVCSAYDGGFPDVRNPSPAQDAGAMDALVDASLDTQPPEPNQDASSDGTPLDGGGTEEAATDASAGQDATGDAQQEPTDASVPDASDS